MRTIINYIKRFPRLFKKEKGSKLSSYQIDRLIETNRDILNRLGDDADYDGMGNYGRFPPIKKK